MFDRSNLPIIYQERMFSGDFRASCETYTQVYQAENMLHYHNCFEIGRCVSGNGVQFIGSDVYSFTPNIVSIVQKDCIHDSHIIMFDPNETPSVWQYIFVDLDALGIPSLANRNFITFDRDLLALFDMMFSELEKQPEGWQEQFRLLLCAFLRIIQRFEPKALQKKTSAAADQITTVLHHITLEYASDLSVEQLAQQCSMSVSYFRKAFSECTGMGPQQYIIHVRLSMAEHLLRTTSKPILCIAQDVGFKSISSFNRLFLRAYGCSPREFRK
ncbi:MAG: helix-turn-helix transcriptional regulator [Clostridia bacterium]|nr:helix-turn-helix transcriptional regulator [Clostridia bacterium]